MNNGFNYLKNNKQQWLTFYQVLWHFGKVPDVLTQQDHGFIIFNVLSISDFKME